MVTPLDNPSVTFRGLDAVTVAAARAIHAGTSCSTVTAAATDGLPRSAPSGVGVPKAGIPAGLTGTDRTTTPAESMRAKPSPPAPVLGSVAGTVTARTGVRSR